MVAAKGAEGGPQVGINACTSQQQAGKQASYVEACDECGEIAERDKPLTSRVCISGPHLRPLFCFGLNAHVRPCHYLTAFSIWSQAILYKTNNSEF